MKTLRTPDQRFEHVAGYPFRPHYIEVTGLRMHYVEEGVGDPVLCLHGEPSWGYLYRKMIPILSDQGRVIAPDLIGFGRSDKPAARSDYTFGLHYDALAAFVRALDLRRITLICQDWGGLLGLPLAVAMPDRFARLVIMNTFLPTGDTPASDAFMRWRRFAERTPDMDIGRVLQGGTVSELPRAVVAAYNAPFPDVSHKAGAHAFPSLVPVEPGDTSAPVMKSTREALRTWTEPTLVLFSDGDPIMAGGDRFFRELIPSAKDEPEHVIHGAGHFLQEDKGEEIAEHVVRFLERRRIR